MFKKLTPSRPWERWLRDLDTPGKPPMPFKKWSSQGLTLKISSMEPWLTSTQKWEIQLREFMRISQQPSISSNMVLLKISLSRLNKESTPRLIPERALRCTHWLTRTKLRLRTFKISLELWGPHPSKEGTSKFFPDNLQSVAITTPLKEFNRISMWRTKGLSTFKILWAHKETGSLSIWPMLPRMRKSLSHSLREPWWFPKLPILVTMLWLQTATKAI